MADSLARAQLARAARELRRAAHSPLPALVLLTDDARLPHPRAAIEALPRGSLVILRTRDDAGRAALASELVRLAREHSLKWLIAGDPLLAARLGADGAHFPERDIPLAARWRVRRPRWLITCAAHSFSACFRAKRGGATALLFSPIFPTASHPGRASHSVVRARSIARAVQLPVYALGGVDAHTAGRLAGSSFVGLAAIGGLACPIPGR